MHTFWFHFTGVSKILPYHLKMLGTPQHNELDHHRQQPKASQLSWFGDTTTPTMPLVPVKHICSGLRCIKDISFTGDYSSNHSLMFCT